MSVKGYLEAAITRFGSPWTRVNSMDVPPTACLAAFNTEYNAGEAAQRKGFTQVWNPSEAITSMFNWVKTPDIPSTQGSYLAYFTLTGTNVRLVPDLTNPTPATMFSEATAITAQFSSSGNQLFVATQASDGTGAGHGRCIGIYGAAINTDKLFLGPMTTKPTLTNTGSGVVTAGVHRVGYVVVTRNGFTGKLSPIPNTGGTFDTTSIVTAPGAQTVSFSLTATWPTEAAQIYIVMTSTTNLNRYFIVPGLGPYGVPGGSSTTVTATINISDADLISTATEVTDNFNLLTQDVFGVAPFNPAMIVAYGQRTVYFTAIGGVWRYYASAVANAQAITADQSVRYLPGQRQISSAFVLRNVLYMLGPHWTYADTDNPTLTPSEWAAPTEIDGQIGALGPLATCVSASQSFVWVADVSGLRVFRGTYYDPRPVSYYVEPDWKRINFKAANLIQVCDNKDKNEVVVLVPLTAVGVVNTSGTAVTWVSGDQFNTSWKAGTAVTINNVAYTIASVASATALTLNSTAGTQTSVNATVTPNYCTHLMKFDYTAGITPEQVMYSLYDLKGANYNPGAMAVVQNSNTKKLELWLGNNSAGKVLRQMNDIDDPLPYNDDGQATNWIYETALLPGMQNVIGPVYRHYAAHVRCRGVGTMTVTSYGLDRTTNTPWVISLALSAATGTVPFRRFAINSEGVSHRFQVNAANQWAMLSDIQHYYAKGPAFR